MGKKRDERIRSGGELERFLSVGLLEREFKEIDGWPVDSDLARWLTLLTSHTSL